LLTKRASPPRENYWFPPGGAIDLGETVEAGITREVLEETGVSISNLQYIRYLDVISKDNIGKIRFHYVVFIFSADYRSGTVKAMDDALEAKWVSIADIKAGILPIPEELLGILDRLGL
jgi:ADP-ribose pyrophosphatase